MDQQEASSTLRRRVWTSLAVAAMSGVSAVTLSLPVVAHADPVAPAPPPSPTTAAPPADPNAAPAPASAAPAPAAPAPAAPGAPAAPPADPNAAPAPAPPADPNAPVPPPADPNAPPPAPAAPEPGRVDNATGGFSYVVPQGWTVGDATRLNYGQALLTKETGPAVNGQPAPVASDTSILLGRLDLKLFAGAEPDNAKAAVRLASDMGEFFMPYPGTRINQQTVSLNAGGMTGTASSYEVKFTDTTKPNGQIWAGVVGQPGTSTATNQPSQRWFVVWLGTAKSPIDPAAATALANSIRPWSPPAPPPAPAPDPNVPAAPPAEPGAPPAAPGGRSPVGVPVPVDPANAPGMVPAG
jgi:hypothetical protein